MWVVVVEEEEEAKEGEEEAKEEEVTCCSATENRFNVFFEFSIETPKKSTLATFYVHIIGNIIPKCESAESLEAKQWMCEHCEADDASKTLHVSVHKTNLT